MARPFRPFLEAAVRGPLSPGEMSAAMSELLDGAVSDAEAAGFLMALRTRGETVEEIAAAARAMRAKAIAVTAPPNAVDTCGTGGDGADTFNISTAAAIVAAGCGAPVAKHGNKAASSKSGSSDVLRALGVNLRAKPATVSRAIAESGVGFMFAAAHHQAVANVANVRSLLGVRTLFNLLGPLTNPAGARRQLMGVFDAALVEPLAEVLRLLGAERAWIVHGADGLDELSTTGPTRVAELNDGNIRTFEVTPEEAGLARATLADLRGGDPEYNADAIRRMLKGERSAFRDIVMLNAGAAVLLSGAADTLIAAIGMAEHAIDSGAAEKSLAGLVRITNEVDA